MWFLKAIVDSGYASRSKMVMIELGQDRVRIIREVMSRMGFEGLAEVWHGDAKKLLRNIGFSVNIAFLDAAKSEYHVYLRLLEPKLAEGSVVFAHNFRMFHPMDEYVELVVRSGRYVTSQLPTRLSLAISVKK